MLKKTIAYTDYNGNTRKEDFYFNLTQAEVTELEVSVEGGLVEMINRIVAAQAADELLNISGVNASAVLYPTGDGGVAVSARSIGNVNVQVLLETLGGGGNRSAAGAQIPNCSLRDAVNRLFAAIDEYRATD